MKLIDSPLGLKDYERFLRSKQRAHPDSGLVIESDSINPKLFDFQNDIVRWALRKGRAAIFADCGLGKSFMQLEWAKHVPGQVLILAPLAVSHQTVNEGMKLGVSVQYSRGGLVEARTITNYQMLHKFAANCTGVVLDESSIVKHYEGKFRNEIIDRFRDTPYKLACTATPAPNDFMELGNHSEFLNNLSRTEMLSTFFVHDGGDTSKWRLKGHAEQDFWKWVCSWAVMLRKPSDLGYADDGFILPPLRLHERIVEAETCTDGMLFAMPALTMQERRQARSGSIEERAAEVASIVAQEPDEQWLIWTNLNNESSAAAKLIPGSIEVRGDDDDDWKVAAIQWFQNGLCVCQGKFRDKFSAWNRKITSNNTIKLIETNDSNRQRNGRPTIESTGSNICMATTPPSLRSSLGEPRHSNVNTTKPGGSVTQKVQNYENDLKGKSVNGKSAIPISDLPSASSYTGSLSNNTALLKHYRTDGVPFVDGIETEIISDLNGYISTTATQRNECEDYSAPHATWDSENSSTTQPSLKRLPCICGKQGRVLTSKCSIFGFGLNLQSCHNVIFFGLSDSFESFYQGVRRIWRFGQKREVDCYIVVSSQEGAVLSNIKRKEADANRMAEEMVNNMHELNQAEIKGQGRRGIEYNPSQKMRLPDFT